MLNRLTMLACVLPAVLLAALSPARMTADVDVPDVGALDAQLLPRLTLLLAADLTDVRGAMTPVRP
jgi:hypothetical protein